MSVTFQKAVLPNGLTIIAETDPKAHSAAVGYFVKTGARDEDTRVMGVSHFLEHMMFKGTAKRTAERLNQDFDSIGAKNNAFTSHEMTCFYATVLPDRLLGENSANEIIADMLRPALRQSDFDTEKNVILEEIAMYDDNPFFVLYEHALEEHYSGDTAHKHALGHRVLGTKQSITDLTSQQMREYFENRYSADNTVVALAGNVEFNRAVDEIEKLTRTWTRTGASRVPGGPAMRDRSFTMHDAKVNRAYALQLSPAPAATDPRRYAASLLAQVLGGPDNSRLHWAIIDKGLADHCEVGFEQHDGCGDFLVFITCDPARKDEVWSIVQDQISQLPRTLCEDDLAKIRTKAATGVTVAGERPGGRMQRLGRQWMYHAAYSTLEDELARINKVTVQDILDTLTAFPFAPKTTAWLLPPSPPSP